MKYKINIFCRNISFIFFIIAFVVYFITSKVDFLIYAILFNMFRFESRRFRDEVEKCSE